jgi:hypothetical protein
MAFSFASSVTTLLLDSKFKSRAGAVIQNWLLLDEDTGPFVIENVAAV